MNGVALFYLYAICMPSQTVSVQMTRLFEQLSTVLTSTACQHCGQLVWPVVCMRSDMGISVGLLFESLTANPTLERPFFSTVDHHVP